MIDVAEGAFWCWVGGRRTPALPAVLQCHPNPIENAFAKLKALLRGLWDTIGSLIDRFTPEKCAHHFAAARYDAN